MIYFQVRMSTRVELQVTQLAQPYVISKVYKSITIIHSEKQNIDTAERIMQTQNTLRYVSRPFVPVCWQHQCIIFTYIHSGETKGVWRGPAPRPFVSNLRNPVPPWAPGKCCKVLFVLQIVSRISVDEVFIHYFEKMLSVSGGFAYRPLPGFWPGTPLGDFLPSDPFILPPGKKSCGDHGSLLVIIPNIAPDLLHSAILLWNKKDRLRLATIRIISTLYSKKMCGAVAKTTTQYWGGIGHFSHPTPLTRTPGFATVCTQSQLEAQQFLPTLQQQGGIRACRLPTNNISKINNNNITYTCLPFGRFFQNTVKALSCRQSPWQLN